MTLILTVLLVALIFEYINGFHDTANAIATIVSTKVLTPRQAIVLSTVFNLLGALTGTAVASTIGQGLVDAHFVSATTLLARVARGDCLEPVDVVAGPALEFEPRADRRALRRHASPRPPAIGR